MVSIGLNIDYSNLQHDAEKCASRMLLDDIYLIENQVSEFPTFRCIHQNPERERERDRHFPDYNGKLVCVCV